MYKSEDWCFFVSVIRNITIAFIIKDEPSTSASVSHCKFLFIEGVYIDEPSIYND